MGAVVDSSGLPVAVTANQGSGAHSQSGLFTNTAGTLLVVEWVMAITSGHGAVTIDSVTYNGVNLTLFQDQTTGSGNESHGSIWYLLNPATGSNTLVVNYTNPVGITGSQDVVAGCITFTGHNTTTPLINGAGASGTSATSGSVTSPASVPTGNIGVGFVANGAGNFNTNSIPTLLFSYNDGGTQCGGVRGGYGAGSGSAITWSETWTGADSWICVCAEVQAAASASAPPRPPLRIPNKYVGPMALRHNFHRAQSPMLFQPSAAQVMSVAGLGSAAQFGSVTARPGNINVAVAGRGSAAQFGAVTPIPGGINVSVAGKTSAAAFGAVTAVPGNFNVAVTGLGSAAQFGTVTPVPGGVVVLVSGLGSAAQFGTVTASSGGSFVSVAGLGSAAAFGTVTAVPGGILVSVSGKTSAAAFGTVTPAPGNRTVSVSGKSSAAQFGVVLANQTLHLVGLGSAAAFGSVTAIGGPVVVVISGLGSAAAFSSITASGGTGPTFNPAIHGGKHK